MNWNWDYKSHSDILSHHNSFPLIDINCLGGKGRAVIYTVKCRMTGLIYVGSTLNPYARLQQHLVKGEPTCKHLHESIKKYGKEHHEVRILFIFNLLLTTDEERKLGRDIMEKFEELAIAKLDTYYPNGLNAVRGRVVAKTGNEIQEGRYFGRPGVDRDKFIL